MKSLLSIILGIIILSSLTITPTEALQLSLYPKEIKIVANQEETICKSFTITHTNISNNILVEDRWTKYKENTRQIDKYILKSENINLDITYNKIMSTEEKDLELCLSSKIPGNYSGALLFRIENTSVGVGSWITLIIKETNNKEINITPKTSPLTGRIISQTNSKINYILLELIFLVLTLIILVILKIKSKKK